MKIIVEKKNRKLTVTEQGSVLFACSVALGFSPEGNKEKEGDGKTPEGSYFVCLKKIGKYGPSLGINYPSLADALRLGAAEKLLQCIREREEQGMRPPWGSFMGGEIYIHGGGTERDWTAGCIALEDADAETLYALCDEGTEVEILP
ncbi:MAG: L,D-transpeptidase [Clostridia bacterium]|nr:L,D-transpeptidase [Clostridia bacterium]